MRRALSLTVLYFAWVKDKVGRGQETLTLPKDVTTVAGLMDWLTAQSAGHAAAFADRRLIKAAVDQQHVDHGAALGDAQEVAFFPPVTGG